MLRRQAGPGMSAARRARSTRWLPLVVAWQVVIVVAVILVLQRQTWALAAAGAVVLIAILLSVPVNGRTLLGTLKTRRRFGARGRQRVAAPDFASDLVPLAQWLPALELTQIKDAHDTEIGVVADGSSWAGVLEVQADNSLFTDRGANLDLNTLSALTRQDDVLFAGIQVVTLTVPAPSGAMLPAKSPALGAYREVVGDQTPPALRRTWIAVRLDPRLCLEAIGRRGSGQIGVFATLRFGLHRAQALLKRQGMVTEPLDPVEIADVFGLTTAAAPDHGEERSNEEWNAWVCDNLIHESREVSRFGANPSATYQRLLDVVALAPAMMAVTSVTVAPGEPLRGAVRLVTATREQATEADEFVVASLQGDVRFGPLGGVQVPGLLATVPLGRQIDS